METFKKRQKAWARKEKQQKKAARKMERRNEKAKLSESGQDSDSTPEESNVQQKPAADLSARGN